MTVIIPRRLKRDVVDDYIGFAKEAATDLHALSGRGHHHDRTRAANAAILRHVDFDQRHRVLDIGCGDGSLLNEIPFVALAAGTVLTGEELEVLNATPHLGGMKFYNASFGELAKVPGKFDRIIANGCLAFSRTPAGAHEAMKNITALLAPGGKLWLGELLAKDQNKREFTSRLEAVKYVYAQYGWRFTIAFLHHLKRHHHRAGRIIALGPHLWFITPDEIPALAERYGLKVLGSWNCQEMTGDPFYALQDRYSVLLQK